jgi:hypothetical protein
MNNGGEYVLFLWAGRSGMNQVIGMSQGVFNLESGVVTRKAASARMVDKAGDEIQDEPVRLGVGELRQRVRQALAAEAQ